MDVKNRLDRKTGAYDVTFSMLIKMLIKNQTDIKEKWYKMWNRHKKLKCEVYERIRI